MVVLNEECLIRYLMGCVVLGACGLRMLPVLRYGVLVNEFDPWFNYRCSEYMWRNGICRYFRWFDDRTWIPEGRCIAETAYPVLFILTNLFHSIIHRFIRVQHYTVCALVPVCGFIGALGLLWCISQEIHTDTNHRRSKGLIALGLFSTAGGLFEKTMAGAYDYESVSLVLILSFVYVYIISIKRSEKSGKLIDYGRFMVGSVVQCIFNGTWGGSIFTDILVYAHSFVTLSNWRVLLGHALLTGAVGMCMPFLRNIPFMVMMKIGVFFMMEIIHKVAISRRAWPFWVLVWGMGGFCALSLGLAGYAVMGGRTVLQKCIRLLEKKSKIYNVFLHKRSHPLVESITEHRPPSKEQAVFLCGILIFLSPFLVMYELGKISAAEKNRNSRIFILLGFVVALGMFLRMERFAFLVAPFLSIYSADLFGDILLKKERCDTHEKRVKKKRVITRTWKIFLKAFALICLSVHLSISLNNIHKITKQVIIVMEGVSSNRKVIIDDFRDSAAYMKNNFPKNSVILSWWDYGYQITGMTDLSTVIDNNTNNYDRISEVANILIGPEKDLSRNHPFLQKILPNKEIDMYIYTVCGYRSKYTLSDLNKLPWIAKIAKSLDKTVIPEAYYYRVQNKYYFTLQEIQETHKQHPMFISQPLRESVLFKLCFYNVDPSVALSHTELVHESANQIVRIYKINSKQ